jgi:hypothetical protein
MATIAELAQMSANFYSGTSSTILPGAGSPLLTNLLYQSVLATPDNRMRATINHIRKHRTSSFLTRAIPRTPRVDDVVNIEISSVPAVNQAVGRLGPQDRRIVENWLLPWRAIRWEA